MNSKGLHLFCDINLILISISLIYTAMTLEFDFNHHFYIITRLTDSWSRAPIQNIQASSVQCNQTINNNYVIQYEWPGTKEGCDCTNSQITSYSFEKKVIPSTCLKVHLDKDCKDVSGKESVNLGKWKKIFLCYSDTGRSYFNNLRTLGNCPDSFKQCGRMDTLGNKLCIKKEEECPLNHISINSAKEEILEFNPNRDESHNGLIVTEFRLSDDKEVCINSVENYFYENSYPLFKENSVSNRRGCLTKQGRDNRFIELDFMSKHNFYHDNSLDEHRYYLPNYPDIGRTFVYLFSGNYIGWDTSEKCLLKDYDSLTHLEEKYLQNRSKYEFRSKCITILMMIAIGLLCIILNCKYLNMNMINKEVILEEKTTLNLICLYGLILLISFFSFVLSYGNVNLILLGKPSIFKDLRTIFFENCSDQENNIALNTLGNSYFSLYLKYNYLKYASFMNLIICTIICLCIFFSKNNLTYHQFNENYSDYNDSEKKTKFD